MSVIVYGLYTSLNLVLFIYGLILWQRDHRMGTFLIAVVTFGLVYDNTILMLGVVLEGGPLLYTLSLPRFYLHQLALPWIIWASYLQVRSLGHDWDQRVLVSRAVLSLTILTLLLGVLSRLVPMDLQLVEMGGLRRYMDKGASGPPIVSVVSIGFAGVMGIQLWRRNGWPWVLLSAILVFISEGFPSELIRRVIGSGAEVLFIVALLRTERFISETKQN
jgi:hypothetical protein